VRPFKGTINLDIRDSKPDWPAFLADKAPEGAPNVLIYLDNTANWSQSFGGSTKFAAVGKAT
jgi:arylsulfatase